VIKPRENGGVIRCDVMTWHKNCEKLIGFLGVSEKKILKFANSKKILCVGTSETPRKFATRHHPS
jgi:hypothetical protein